MARGFRSVFVCLMALALSVSGYASAAKCGGVPIPAPQSIDQSIAAAGMDPNPALIDGAHPCAMDCAMEAHGVRAVKASTGDCPASAACGMVAAPAPQTPVPVIPTAGADRALPPSTPGFGFFTDAPDRPPRALA